MSAPVARPSRSTRVLHSLAAVLGVTVLVLAIAVGDHTTALAGERAVEAESFALPAGSGTVFDDPTASGNAGLLIWSDATATSTVTTGGVNRFVVRVRGDQCSGAPVVTLTVDAAVVGTRAVTDTTWTDVGFDGSWLAGSHRLGVSYVNDQVGAGCDRNLRVDRVVAESDATPAPATSRTFGLSSAGPDQGIPAALATARSVNRTLDVVNFYQAWSWATPLPVDQLTEAARAGVTPEITWEPWDPGAGVSQPAFQLWGIAGGAFDWYVAGWARAAAAYRGPIALRFGHEMNGSWYPWAAAENGGSPDAYVAAYRHVHDLFVAAGASNVSWVWSPNVVQGMPTPLTGLYPGAGYVDVIGVDGYNGGTDVADMGGWRTPAQVFDPTLQALRVLAPGVPIVVNETGSSEHGGSKAAWIADLVAYLGRTEVRGLYWFDYDNVGQSDWRLASSAASLTAAGAALPYW